MTCKVTDKMYAVGRNIEERMGIKKKDYQRNNKTSGNRSIWKVERAKRHKNNGCANCKRFIP